MTTSLTTPATKYKREFIDRLNQIDFGCIAYKLMNPEEGTACSKVQATQAIEGYRKFLLLNYLYPDQIIVPSKTIDRVWHVHILDTSKYQKDCETLFGHFLDHFPYFGIRDEEDRKALEGAFLESQALWEKHFGVEM